METEIINTAKDAYFSTIFLEKYASFALKEGNGGNSSIKDLWFTSTDIGEIYNIRSHFVDKEIDNIFNKFELSRDETTKYFPDLKTGDQEELVDRVRYVNLQVALLVGLKVDTSIGRAFRRFATSKMSEYLIDGYLLNHEKINSNIVAEIKEKVHALVAKAKDNEVMLDMKKVVTNLARAFKRSFDLMHDTTISDSINFVKAEKILTYTDAKEMVKHLKSNLQKEGAFGLEKEYTKQDTKLKTILTNIMCMDNDRAQLAALQMRAAHLFYQIIKEKPFVDGNKRIASMLFLYYLEISGMAMVQLNASTLAAMALLCDFSNQGQQDTVIKLIVNLIG